MTWGAAAWYAAKLVLAAVAIIAVLWLVAELVPVGIYYAALALLAWAFLTYTMRKGRR